MTAAQFQQTPGSQIAAPPVVPDHRVLLRAVKLTANQYTGYALTVEQLQRLPAFLAGAEHHALHFAAQGSADGLDLRFFGFVGVQDQSFISGLGELLSQQLDFDGKKRIGNIAEG